MSTLPFLLGLVVGSFLNAFIFRMREGGSVWHGRSYCPKCRKALFWYELIPLVSFVIQRGRCRGCHEKIDPQYPIIEITTAILFLVLYGKVSNTFFGDGIPNFQFPIFNIGHWVLGLGHLIIFWYLFSALIVLFMYDLRYSLVPDRVVLPAIIVAFLYNVVVIITRESARQSVLSAVGYLLLATIVGAGFFAVQYYLSRGRWLGDGDIRIGALMGAMLGWPQLLTALVISYMIGGACGVIVLAAGRKKFGQTLPLVTFLTLGTAIVFLYGEQIWSWYWR